MALLEVTNLVVEYPLRHRLPGGERTFQAVRGVSFTIERGETVGLVGESGCGKSTLARAILRLTPASSGAVTLEGRDFFGLQGVALRMARRKMQVVFQDPMASLNPRLTIERIVGEGLEVHRLTGSREELRERVIRVLRQVGLDATALRKFPHQFSGGQRQRIGIARALAVDPDLLICDEPVSALDVSIQAQILNLIKDLREQRHLASLFIAHDLAAVEHVSHRILVMYLGRIVEAGSTRQIVDEPRHPYTRALIAAASTAPMVRLPALNSNAEPPSPASPPAGCPYHPRCPLAQPICREALPPLRGLPHGGHAACHFA